MRKLLSSFGENEMRLKKYEKKFRLFETLKEILLIDDFMFTELIGLNN
jgi:hypothetical protein